MNVEARLEAYETIFGPLEKLEWSGVRHGPGDGPHGSGDGGTPYAACPVCGGLEKPNNSFISEAVGHQPGCVLAFTLGKKTRKLNKGEQGRLSI